MAEKFADGLSAKTTVENHRTFEFGSFKLDTRERLLSAGGVIVPITPKVFDLLTLFVQNPGRLLEKDWLLAALWPETFVEEANLSVNVSTLRRALETMGGAHHIETIPKHGYRFKGEVRVSTVTQEEICKAHPAQIATPATWSRGWQIALLGSLLLGALGLPLRLWLFPSIKSLSEVRSIAVLPFRPLAGAKDATSGKEDVLLGIGIADAVTRELSLFRKIRVRPISSVQKYFSGQVEPRAAGRELNVDVVMDGRIQHIGQIVRISVQILRVEDGTPVWADRFDDYDTNIFQLQDSISEKVAAALKMKLSETGHIKMTKRGTASLEAYESYLQGSYCEMSRPPDSPLNGCIDNYKAAVAKDPNYALAYAGIARVCIELAAANGRPELKKDCRDAAQKAISLDDDLPEAHLAMGNVFFRADWNWLAARREFNRGLALDDYSPMAHSYMALLLMAMGRPERALDEMNNAQLLDPSSPALRIGLIWAYNCSGRYDEAIHESKQMIALSPKLFAAHRELGRAYLESGSYGAALAEFEILSKLDVTHSSSADIDYLAALAEYRLTKKADVLAACLKTLQIAQAVPASRDHSYEIAVLNANLGKFDDAFAALERAADLKLQSALWMLLDPDLEPVKHNPRFIDLSRRLHLIS